MGHGVDAPRRVTASLGLAYVQEARITADPSYYPKAEGVLRRSIALDRKDNDVAATDVRRVRKLLGVK